MWTLIWLLAFGGEVFEGTAHNGKGGAILQTGDDRVIYVAGLASWPDEVVGRTVKVRGDLASESYLVEATQGADGGWSQGVPAGSTDWVLRDAAWLPPAPWSVSVSDGSANVTKLWHDGTEAGWVFEPMTPERSSSGAYSGGEPAKGALTDEQAIVVWEAVRAAERTPAALVEKRELGTTLITVQYGDLERRSIVRRGAADAVLEAVGALRATATE